MYTSLLGVVCVLESIKEELTASWSWSEPLLHAQLLLLHSPTLSRKHLSGHSKSQATEVQVLQLLVKRAIYWLRPSAFSTLPDTRAIMSLYADTRVQLHAQSSLDARRVATQTFHSTFEWTSDTLLFSLLICGLYKLEKQDLKKFLAR